MLLSASWTHPSSLVCNRQPCPRWSGCTWPRVKQKTCTCLRVLALHRMPFKPLTGIQPLSKRSLLELKTHHFVESKPQNHIKKKNRQLRACTVHTIKKKTKHKHLLKVFLYHPRYYLPAYFQEPKTEHWWDTRYLSPNIGKQTPL